MREDQREKMRVWVNNWKEAGKVMEELRRDEIRNSNLAESIGLFDLAFRSAISLNPPLPTSGLVEFHRILAKTK